MTGETWLTVAQVAELLQLSPVAVQGWIRRGQLPAVNLGGKAGYRIRARDLDAYLAARWHGGPPPGKALVASTR
jgi:excisionase family DNA binding protein